MRIYMISSLGSGSHCMGIVKSFDCWFRRGPGCIFLIITFLILCGRSTNAINSSGAKGRGKRGKTLTSQIILFEYSKYLCPESILE
jgi:hypothetical protein